MTEKFNENLARLREGYAVAAHRRFDELHQAQPLLRQGCRQCAEGMPLLVHWEITHRCNYRCSYCFQRDHTGSPCTPEQAASAVRHIAAAARPAYQVELLGGEPLLHPHLRELTQMLTRELGQRLEVMRIVTNGSRLHEAAGILTEAARETRVAVAVSVHLEHADTDKLRGFIEDYAHLFSLEIALMAHPGRLEQLREVARQFTSLRRDHAFDLTIGLLREPPHFVRHYAAYSWEEPGWADELRAAFEKAAAANPRKAFRKQDETGQNFYTERDADGTTRRREGLDATALQADTGLHFGGMHCCVGANVLEIKPDGRARGAICDIVSTACNIYEENPFEQAEWIHAVPCISRKCFCPLNHRIPKFRNPDEAQRFVQAARSRQAELRKG